MVVAVKTLVVVVMEAGLTAIVKVFVVVGVEAVGLVEGAFQPRGLCNGSGWQ